MQKSCRQCTQQFEITDDDLQFYDRVSPVFAGKKHQIPPPTLCPDCRSQRRMIWRAELNLFKRKSDFSGKEIISFYPPGADCKVYPVEEWWSDAWNPLDYGRDFDFSRPFFKQFAELVKVVPLKARSVSANENSDYINCASWCKNCYLLAGANHNEDCYYGNYVNQSRNCIDNSFVTQSELCYECVDCKNCYKLQYSFNCHNCSDSFFLYNCKSCKNCFGSVNLVQKEYVFMNEQLTKEQYQKRLEEMQLFKRSKTEEFKKIFDRHRLKFPHKYMEGELNENVSGNNINECRNTFECFDDNNLEDCKCCIWLNKSKNCMDIYAWGFTAEECYECTEVGDNSYRTLFSVTSYGGATTLYSYYSMHSPDIFGCVSLHNKQYCILNKQYSKEEYEKLLPRIIEHMQKTGEWGEFFPMWVSPLAYNQTVCQDYMPLEKDEAAKLGAKWNDEAEAIKPDKITQIPDSIHDVNESVCGQTLTCAATGKPFKIIPQEFRFYKQNNVPLPVYCFEARHKARLAKRNPRKLWDRKCAKCETDIRTSYAPGRPEIVYCEKCYLKAVY